MEANLRTKISKLYSSLITYAHETNNFLFETQTKALGFEPSYLSIRLAFDWRANQLSRHGSIICKLYFFKKCRQIFLMYLIKAGLGPQGRSRGSAEPALIKYIFD